MTKSAQARSYDEFDESGMQPFAKRIRDDSNDWSWCDSVVVFAIAHFADSEAHSSFEA
jgi:hypothetical protein